MAPAPTTSPIFQLLSLYEHSYDGSRYRIEVGSPRKDFSAFGIKFTSYETADDVIHNAVTKLHAQLEHQVRPFGSCHVLTSIRTDPRDWSTPDTVLGVAFKDSLVTDVTVKRLMTKILQATSEIAKVYHIGDQE